MPIAKWLIIIPLLSRCLVSLSSRILKHTTRIPPFTLYAQWFIFIFQLNFRAQNVPFLGQKYDLVIWWYDWYDDIVTYWYYVIYELHWCTTVLVLDGIDGRFQNYACWIEVQFAVTIDWLKQRKSSKIRLKKGRPFFSSCFFVHLVCQIAFSFFGRSLFVVRSRLSFGRLYILLVAHNQISQDAACSFAIL